MLHTVLIVCASLIAIHKSVVFVSAVIRRDNSVVDIFYGLGFVLVALGTYFVFGTGHFVQQLVTLLVIIWGVRLSYRIYMRNRHEPEDWRYAHWREQWMRKGIFYFFIRSAIQVFFVQGVIMLAVSLPIILVNSAQAFHDTNVFAILGTALWIFGFIFEVVADKQLADFFKQKNNAGSVMTRGLFKYSRRPNYFGEAVMWWGLWIVALTVPGGIIAVISPIVITYTVYFISGPMLEARLMNNSAFQEYKKSTNYFFPWRPKQTKK